MFIVCIKIQWGKNGRVVKGAVGFMGGEKPNPTYREVCSGQTGHVEVLDVELGDPEAKLDMYFRMPCSKPKSSYTCTLIQKNKQTNKKELTF